VDTGASDHMSHNKDLFISLEVLVRPHTVNFPNGTFMTVPHGCMVMINNTLALHGVFYIHGFKYNRQSVSKVSGQQNFLVVFAAKYFIVKAHSIRKPQVLSEHYAGLYLLHSSVPIASGFLDKLST